MKILIVGGHLAPALALIQHLPDTAEVVYVGRKYTFEGDEGISLEYQTIQSLNIRFIPFQTGRLQRSFTKHSLPSLLKFTTGIPKARELLKKEKPDIVVGFGGYLSLPIGLAAWTLKIPLVIHEQTLRAGLANKLLGKIATKIAISWEESKKYFPSSKTVLIGNPHFNSHPDNSTVQLIEKTKDRPRLFITGGSSGSHAINLAIEAILPELLQKYHVIHQTGDATEFMDFERLDGLKRTLSLEQQEHYHLVKFIHPSDFDFLCEHATLVIGRSGINTVTTLILLGVPALLIPLEHGQKNEQRTNAKLIEKIGLGKIFYQSENTTKLLHSIHDMVENRDIFIQVDIRAYQERHKNAAASLASLLYVIIQGNTETKS